MILTVTANAALDKSYAVPGFAVGRIHRVERVQFSPGGKGLNVASVAHILGAAVAATGFVAGHTGRLILELLDQRGIAHDFVAVEGESRTCIVVTDAAGGPLTELLEPGPTVTPHHEAILTEKVQALGARGAVAAFSGSLPAGASPDLYARLIRAVKAQGARVILDTSGEALRQGMAAGPDLIKPNEAELRELVRSLGLAAPSEAAPKGAAPKGAGSDGGAPDGPAADGPAPDGDAAARRRAAATAARLLQERTGVTVVASLGEAGAVVADGKGLWAVSPLPVRVINTVGCGDALVGGIACALERGEDLAAAVRLGTAAAAAKATLFETGIVRPADVAALLPSVRWEPLAF